jgi:hypothetical protein
MRDRSTCDSQRVELRGSARHDSDFFFKENGASGIAKLNVVLAGPQVEFLEMAGDAKVSAIKVVSFRFICDLLFRTF